MYTVSGTTTLSEVTVLPLENEDGDVSRTALHNSKCNPKYCTNIDMVVVLVPKCVCTPKTRRWGLVCASLYLRTCAVYDTRNSGC